METLNYKVLEGTGYNGYILKDAPVKVMQFGVPGYATGTKTAGD